MDVGKLIEVVVMVVVGVLWEWLRRRGKIKEVIGFVIDRVRLFEEIYFILLKLLMRGREERIKEVLRKVGLELYLLVEQWGKKNNKKGDEKFQKFLEELRERLGVDEIEEAELREVIRFIEIINFVQNNEKDFIRKANEVIEIFFKVRKVFFPVCFVIKKIFRYLKIM